VRGEDQLRVARATRVRDVRQGPDGLLYVVTDEQNGELLRLAPKGR
jgi:glucose/arabinose dehydrogenase